MKQLFFSFCLVFLPLCSQELRMLYQKEASPSSPYEKELVEHVKTSLEKAVKLESKLTTLQFVEVDASKTWRRSFIPHYHLLSDLPSIPYYHLLNNLCHFSGASHLHVGLLAGDSYIAALYGNQHLLEQQIGVDWFRECPEDVFRANCDQYLDSKRYQIINKGCFDVDKSLFTDPIDIYFYDADHSLKAHEKAFVYYNDIFADAFIAVIDDWGCSWIRGATFKAFVKLNYSILYEDIIRHGESCQYVAVIRKRG